MPDYALEIAVHGEINMAREQMRDIAWIRVSPDAIDGLLAVVPVTPERARQIRLADWGNGVDVDPALIARPPLELLIHPHDWYRLLANAPFWRFGFGEAGCRVESYCGIRVVGG